VRRLAAPRSAWRRIPSQKRPCHPKPVYTMTNHDENGHTQTSPDVPRQTTGWGCFVRFRPLCPLCPVSSVWTWFVVVGPGLSWYVELRPFSGGLSWFVLVCRCLSGFTGYVDAVDSASRACASSKVSAGARGCTRSRPARSRTCGPEGVCLFWVSHPREL